ncbi:MAG: hypothetical protein R6V53_01575 [Candidatus Woesearchaeota archaeon]
MKHKITQHLQSVGDKWYIDVLEGQRRINFNDYFNIGNLMQYLHDWLVENGWGSPKDDKFGEVFYHHIFKQSGDEEVRWWWRFERDPPGESAGFLKCEMNVDVRIIAMKKTEQMKQGMKFKTNHGDMEIGIEGRVVIDADKKWRSHKLMSHLLKFYVYQMINDRVMGARDFMKEEADRFTDALKAYFKMPGYSPEAEAEGHWGHSQDFD